MQLIITLQVDISDLESDRYLNMDYLYFSSLRDTKIKRLVVSYDIACQWRLNLFNRMEIMPESLCLSPTIEAITYLMPKFHLPAHIKKCNLMFSFNLTWGGWSNGWRGPRAWLVRHKSSGTEHQRNGSWITLRHT